MKHFFNFLLGAFLCFSALTLLPASKADTTPVITGYNYITDKNAGEIVDTIAKIPVYSTAQSLTLPNAMIAGTPVKVPDLTELLKYLLSTLGGIITSIVLAFLRKKFPDWFPESIVKRN